MSETNIILDEQGVAVKNEIDSPDNSENTEDCGETSNTPNDEILAHETNETDVTENSVDADMKNRIDGIISKIKEIGELSAVEKDRLAALIDRGRTEKDGDGANSANGAKMSGAELVDALFASDEAMRLLEARRVANLESRYDSSPQFAVSRGGVSMPANIPARPKNIEQAGRAAKKYFGII